MKVPVIGKRLLIGVFFLSIVGFPLSAWTLLGVSARNLTLAFGTKPTNTWLPPQATVIVNDGTELENLAAKISQLTAGGNTWALSADTNGVDSIRAQWSISSESGPWTDVSAYDTDFPIKSSLPASDSINFWLRIQTPTTTISYDEHSATLTVMASLP